MSPYILLAITAITYMVGMGIVTVSLIKLHNSAWYRESTDMVKALSFLSIVMAGAFGMTAAMMAPIYFFQ